MARAVIGMLMMSLVAACGQATSTPGSGSSDRTSASADACSVPPELARPLERRTTADELAAAVELDPSLEGMHVGVWRFQLAGDDAITVTPNGGTIRVDACAMGDQVKLGVEVGGACESAGDATYKWVASSSDVEFHLVEDGCGERELTMAGGPWSVAD